MSKKKQINFILPGLLLAFLCSIGLTVGLYFIKMPWIGTISLCLALVLLQSIILLSGPCVFFIFSRQKEQINSQTLAEIRSNLLIIYGSIAFFFLFYVFSIAFVKSYQMAQIMVFGCGVLSPLISIPIVIGFRKQPGFFIPLLNLARFGALKLWHIKVGLLILITLVSIKIVAYNPAFFHTSYTCYVTKSTVDTIQPGDVLVLTFSYQKDSVEDYVMHLCVRHKKNLLFGKFGHGIVFGSMEVNQDGTYVLDVYDTDEDDGDPAVSLNTKTALFTYLSIGKHKGELEAALD